MAEHSSKSAETDAEVRKQIEEDDKTINTDDLVKYSLMQVKKGLIMTSI